mgnify:CR=1 FL=1
MKCPAVNVWVIGDGRRARGAEERRGGKECGGEGRVEGVVVGQGGG